MANQQHPDGRLVYLHCSSIFSGADAHIRKVKKISQLLQKHKASIKILTKEFTLTAIGAVAKQLLEEGIFESLPRARLRYPELFQPSETQEAERAASEADVLRIEAEAARDILLTSDDDREDVCLGFEQEEEQVGPEGTVRAGVKDLENVQAGAARKWHEVESVELTQWTQRFVKYVKDLPPSATKPIAGKSIKEALLGTSALRHSAVHRHRTSAAGIVNMLSGAITFAEALNDSKRAKSIAEIKTNLENSIEEIVQHQNLLERKLIDQLEEIARRRAELNRLERSSIEEMLAVDEKQRTEVGSIFESGLVGSQSGLNSCPWNCEPSFDRARADLKERENIESGDIDQQSKSIETVEQDPFHQRNPPCKEDYCQNNGLKEKDSPLQKHKDEDSAGEIAEASKPVSPFEGSKEKKQNGKKAVSSQVFPGSEEASAIDEAHDEAWSLGAIPTEAHPDAEEAMSDKECHLGAPKGAFGRVEHCSHPKKIIREDPFLAGEAASKGDPPPKDEVPQEDKLEDIPPNSVIECYDNLEEQTPDPHGKSMLDSIDPYLPKPESDVAPGYSRRTEAAKLFVSPPRSATSSVHRKSNADADPPPAQLSTMSSVLEPVTPEAQMHEGHAIALKIIHGSKILRSVVFVKACTRTAILNEAREYCVKHVQDDPKLGKLPANDWKLSMESLCLDGFDMDMSTYEVENLSFLVETIEKTEIPRFTLRVV
ncbi:MAG: hypothetical protein Q9195_009157 [Heterodermia aff. obscurata]